MLHRECADRKVIAVCHGEVMWAFRARIERMTQIEYRKMEDARLVKDHLHNCQIVHYTRKNPYTGEIAPSFMWMRSICPWDLTRCNAEWQLVNRPVFSNAELLAETDQYPRLIADDNEVMPSAGSTTQPSEFHNSLRLDPAYTPAAVPQKAASLKVGANAQLRSQEEHDYLDAVDVLHSIAWETNPVLIVSKDTRFEQERIRLGCGEKDLETVQQAFTKAGLPFARLHQSFAEHERAVQTIAAAFQSRVGVPVRIVKSNALTAEDVRKACLVISAGGDGTFLKTASMFKDSKDPPVLGINTDPDRSRGALCTLSVRDNLAGCVDFLATSNFPVTKRSRIKVVMTSPDGVRHPSFYVLNEVFFAEKNPARASTYELRVDDAGAETQRSSGVLVCTGTGSTAWMKNALQIPHDTTARVLQEAGHRVPGVELERITAVVNEFNIFGHSSAYVQYLVREPVPTRPGESFQHRHGWARKLILKALGQRMMATIDGLTSVDVPYGTELVLATDSTHELRCIDFPADVLRRKT
eukprot:TRINITY_DN14756_c0_g1_i1.p1 TRINITY_DN14756_c0_g1~~TRINITY_DN14756_c0_g1_i1.p1  ORF type:complete len:526 (+),score=98.81 TRINITY_DN14756_c0_g1_i1:589-2166(+)